MQTFGVIFISVILLIGAFLGIFLNSDNQVLWISLLNLVAGFWLQKVNFAPLQKIVDPEGAEQREHTSRKRKAKEHIDRLPEDYKKKVALSIIKKLNKESKQEILTKTTSSDELSETSQKNNNKEEE